MSNIQNNSWKKYEIISCSRRTDIPAFNMEWVLNKIKQEFVDVANPFNKKQISRVSLLPEDVKCIVWWSKDFGNWIQSYINNRELFDKYKGHYFQFTINSPSELEKNLTLSLEERFSQLRWLLDKYGKLAVNFRFDPIVLYKKVNDSKIYSNLGKFEEIIDCVSEFGIKEMIFSFITWYPKVKKRMLSRGFIPIILKYETKKRVLKKIIKIAQYSDIKLYACCQPDLLKVAEISQAHCIDAVKIEKLIGETIKKEKDRGQRNSCGCCKSKDIGGYTGIFKCKHNCAYCYANPSRS